jgi:hypothetical protein
MFAGSDGEPANISSIPMVDFEVRYKPDSGETIQNVWSSTSYYALRTNVPDGVHTIVVQRLI